MSKVKVSTMTGKLKGLAAINSSPLDNPYCKAMAAVADNICSHCYSVSMLKGLRKNCRPSWKANGELLSSQPLTDKEVPKIKTELCRFSAHGELINKTHADNLFTIARKNATVMFALFTKRPQLVDTEAVPANVVLVYSSPKVNTLSAIPKGFHKVFTVWTLQAAEESDVVINCGAKSCDTCRHCYDKDNGIAIVNEVIK